MKITVAGVEKEYPGELTVRELIKAEDVESPEYVTVTINDDFVKSDELDTKIVKDGDSVEFLYFMGGGSL